MRLTRINYFYDGEELNCIISFVSFVKIKMNLKKKKKRRKNGREEKINLYAFCVYFVT